MKTDLVVGGYIFHGNRVLLVHHRKSDLWLPVGGHIDKDETPDDALVREVLEETGLKIDILGKSSLPVVGHVRRNLAAPFDVNVHSVGDHDHCSLFYVCRALNPEALQINEELLGCQWFTKEDLKQDQVPPDVRNQALLAFDIFHKAF